MQRNLSAKNVSHSKAACVVASYLKILPFFLFVWPGMISRILFSGKFLHPTEVFPDWRSIILIFVVEN